jgi:hypothetical protein
MFEMPKNLNLPQAVPNFMADIVPREHICLFFSCFSLLTEIFQMRYLAFPTSNPEVPDA